ncbi:hypothetical protein LIER_38079 [Lithospermum erythrorhizon]|uniref:Uncharacterized protein n=1 Tax=Lithospermum erythrorhizon TaxID=34254 RepID=A0AAV3PUD5_LITER
MTAKGIGPIESRESIGLGVVSSEVSFAMSKWSNKMKFGIRSEVEVWEEKLALGLGLGLRFNGGIMVRARNGVVEKDVLTIEVSSPLWGVLLPHP